MRFDRPLLGDPIRFLVEHPVDEFYTKVGRAYDVIDALARKFLEDKTGPTLREAVQGGDEHKVYTALPAYYEETMHFHRDPWVQAFTAHVIRDILPEHQKKVVDVGCAFGVTGLTMALHNVDVTFFDYPGLGLDFLRWVKETEPKLGEKITVMEYGDPIRRHTMVLAIDVLEHLPNQLAGIKWFKELGDLVVMSYPTRVPYRPPYEKEGIDRWVDDEIIQLAVAYRWQLMESTNQYGWRSMIYG